MAARSRLWIRVASDVHLEFRENLTTDRKWASLIPRDFSSSTGFSSQLDRSCLVLAGDVGYPSSAVYGNFLSRCKAAFDHVVVIAGNHESYRQKVRVDQDRCRQDSTYVPDLEDRAGHKGRVRIRWTDEWARQVCERVGAAFLQKSTCSIPLPDGTAVRFAGCTLWSSVPAESALEASYSLNDFNHALDDDGKPLSVEAYNRLHRDHVAWLTEQLTGPTPPDVTVVHHLPTSKLVHPRFAGSGLNCCFASDSIPEGLMSRSKLWCAGHSHAFMDKTLTPGTRAIVNPLGYPGEDTGYSPDWHHCVEGSTMASLETSRNHGV